MSFHTNARQLFWVPLGIFTTLTALIAVGPALAQRAETERVPLPPGDPDVLRGRALFIAEGCAVCHTQQVRVDNRMPPDDSGVVPPLSVDARYGPASEAIDYATQSPPLLGTERIGPDLANIGDRNPNEAWHLLHLYRPRAVSPGSVMQPYPWYFHEKSERKAGEDKAVTLPDGSGEVYATPDAQHLVKYLLSLKKAPKAQ